jgi:hypothetical protein
LRAGLNAETHGKKCCKKNGNGFSRSHSQESPEALYFYLLNEFSNFGTVKRMRLRV